jgi:hypothetical protein
MSLKPYAQVELLHFYTLGSSNVSEDFYLKTSLNAKYTYQTHSMGIGGQMDVMSSAENRSPVFEIAYGKRFPVESFPIDVKVFYMYNRFSKRMYETNYGITGMLSRKHWSLELGTDFRTFRLTKKAVEEYSTPDDTKVRENFNTLYALSGLLKPRDHKWNVGITITNQVNFIILQETNPMFYVEALVQPRKTITFYFDAGYMNAGAFNLSVNPFAYYFKMGIQWNIN